ncbi:2-hydroxychromene-2-carboxylate isomerase [Pandoraea iniqua]|uniref:2-hydroxychromene-2-carboxylate isomerase n=1 Tax=Pandoraea iniqua TaxID=2508288 RepID=A0A5E4SDR3_9BURK|nr:DsbA family protein [Pandoraea iniqua]VVD73253.1 2-hydroxychromene-2-carboxylate isomerase [Pandoraea iniqua]
MTSAIDFYFDFASPYGYFASTCIDEIANKYGRGVAWHPILLDIVYKVNGTGAPVQHPIKTEYMRRDVERTARFQGIAYKRPSHFPIPTQCAERAVLWVADHRGGDLAAEFAKLIYRALYVDDVNIGEPAELVRLGETLGIDGAALDKGMHSPAAKDHLKAEIDLAMARGVFGSPFVIVDGEPFWGYDRFGQVEACLQNGKV